jgi:hypothetical protein
VLGTIVVIGTLLDPNNPTTHPDGTRVTSSATARIASTSLSRTPTTSLTELGQKSTKGVTYEQLARNPAQYELAVNPMEFSGKVVQIMGQGSDGFEARVAITREGDFWTDDVYVFATEALETRLLEDDVLRFYAWARGLVSYETVMGASREVPKLELIAIAHID